MNTFHKADKVISELEQIFRAHRWDKPNLSELQRENFREALSHACCGMWHVAGICLNDYWINCTEQDADCNFLEHFRMNIDVLECEFYSACLIKCQDRLEMEKRATAALTN
jgi:hypothetical protein